MTTMSTNEEPCGFCSPCWDEGGELVSSCHGCGVLLEAACIIWSAPDTCLITFQTTEGYEHDPGCQGAHSSGPHWEALSVSVEWTEPDCWVTACGNSPSSGSMACDAHRCQATATTRNERCGNTAKNGPWCIHHRYPSGFPRDFTPTPEMRTWADENIPDIDHEAETARFVAYWAVKRLREPREYDWPQLWCSWMTVARDEALRLAKVPRNSGINPGMIKDARRIVTG